MKFKLVLTTMLLIMTSFSFAGTFQMFPDMPITEFSLKIRYTADTAIYKSVNLVVYTFQNNVSQPIANEVELKKDMFNTYIGEYYIPKNSLFLIFKIEDIDNNYGEFWTSLIYDTNGKAVKSSPLKAALAYLGNNPSEYSINTNFKKAKELMELELSINPENIQAKIAIAVLDFDTKKITYKEFQNILNKILSNKVNIDSDGIAKSLSRAYKVLNQTESANKIEKEYASNNPKSELAEELLLSDLSSANDEYSFTKFAISFLKNFPTSQNKNKVISALVSALLQSNKFDDLNKIADSLNLYSPALYSAIATEIRQNKKVLPQLNDSMRLAESIKIAEKAVKLTEDSSFYHSPKPQSITKKEFLISKNLEKANVYETLSELYRKSDKQKASEYLEKSLQFYGSFASRDIYIKLIDYYHQENKFTYCLQTVESAMLNTYIDSFFVDLHKKYYSKLMVGETDSNYKFVINKLIESGQNEIEKRLKTKEVKINVPSIILSDTRAGFLDTDDMNGKVYVLFFWSSWCEPCKTAFPAFEELTNYYSNRDDVKFVSINVWDIFENKSDKLQKFLDEFDSELPAYYNEKDLAGAKFNLNGLPAFLYINSKKEIRFFENGFTNDFDFIDNATNKIDYLLKK